MLPQLPTAGRQSQLHDEGLPCLCLPAHLLLISSMNGPHAACAPSRVASCCRHIFVPLRHSLKAVVQAALTARLAAGPFPPHPIALFAAQRTPVAAAAPPSRVPSWRRQSSGLPPLPASLLHSTYRSQGKRHTGFCIVVTTNPLPGPVAQVQRTHLATPACFCCHCLAPFLVSSLNCSLADCNRWPPSRCPITCSRSAPTAGVSSRYLTALPHSLLQHTHLHGAEQGHVGPCHRLQGQQCGQHAGLAAGHCCSRRDRQG